MKYDENLSILLRIVDGNLLWNLFVSQINYYKQHCKCRKKVEEIIEEVHHQNTSIIQYNSENSLSCVLSLAYYSAKKDYVMYLELAGGDSFEDLVFVPRKNCQTPAFIVELKWNQSAETAIDQIKEKKYAKCLQDYTGEILLVGINYDRVSKEDNKKHICVIEKIRK